MNVEVIGFVAGTLGVIALLPQVIKSWRTKSTKDISLQWAILGIFSQVLWLAYGIALKSFSLTVMSGVNLVLISIILVLKIRYDNRAR